MKPTNVYRVVTMTAANEIASELRRQNYHAHSGFEHNYPIVVTDATWSTIDNLFNDNPHPTNFYTAPVN